MEVSGRRADTDVAAGSAKATPLCEPCRAEGKEQEAHGFCNNCNVYICPSCIKVHEILTVTKYHNVLGKQKMPIHYPSSQKAADVSGLDLCQDHPSEVSKFYCPKHEQFGCWDCIVLNHRTCKIDYIPKVAHSFTASSEFKVLVDKVTKLEADLNTWTRKLQSDKHSVLDLNQVQLKRLEEFRVEINEYLDKQEKALVEAMDEARKKDTDRIQRWREDIDAAKLTLAETKSRLEAQDKNANHIYVTARHAQQILGDMQTLIKKVETENMVTRYKFSRDKKTEDLLMWEDAIGKVIEHLDFFTTKWNRATDINIMTPEDTKTCLIRGSAVLRPDTLLLADLYNQCLKTLDLTTGKVTSRLSLYEKPWDVCVLPEDRAAVTLSYGHQTKVQFINTGNALETDKYIVVSAFCRGIAHQDGRLYLTFPHTSPRIEVRTMNGDVLQTIGNTPLQDKVFYGPSFLTISRDDISTIYVSDKNRTLLQMSLQGEVLQKKSYEELVDLGGLADVGGGQVIVCCSNTVMVISGLDGRMKTILETNDGMKRPYTVAYCPTNKKLLVGGNDNRVNVYDLANQ